MSNDQSHLKGWTADRVRQHLQNAVYLEMWTVPLYLTAAYSLDVPPASTGRPEFAAVPTKDGKPDFGSFTQTDYNQYAFNNILSVAIQEMLHVELASNLLNAVRTAENPSSPVFTSDDATQQPPDCAPVYDALPPCLAHAKPPDGVRLGLGPFDKNQALLFQWIEHDQKVDPSYDKEQYRDSYDSIGLFYTALMYGIQVCWGDLYPSEGRDPDPLQRDDWESGAKSVRGGRLLKFVFPKRQSKTTNGLLETSYERFSIKVYGSFDAGLERAKAALTGIMVQGEGAGGTQHIPVEFQPTGDPGDAIEVALDKVSHYERFTELVGLVDKFSYVQPIESPAPALYIQVLNQSYSSFLVGLQGAFADPSKGFSLGAMAGLGNRTLQAWENSVAPAEMYQWVSSKLFVDPDGTKGFHACQGLDPAGTSECAYAFFHVCSTTNVCKGQGGCGLAATPPPSQDDWTPNRNSCQGKGGCGAPIPVDQVFNANPDPNQGGLAPSNLQNKSVWEYAREQMGFTEPLTPSPIRASLTPTSPVYPPKAKPSE
jgi:hypothetical protein